MFKSSYGSICSKALKLLWGYMSNITQVAKVQYFNSLQDLLWWFYRVEWPNWAFLRESPYCTPSFVAACTFGRHYVHLKYGRSYVTRLQKIKTDVGKGKYTQHIFSVKSAKSVSKPVMRQTYLAINQYETFIISFH